MRIESLYLKNFRGFRDLEINFPQDRNTTVFIGINGSGKSSILDALAILLSRFATMLTDTNSRNSVFPFTEDDFAFESNFCNLEMSLVFPENDRSRFFFEVSPANSNYRRLKGDTSFIKMMKELVSEKADVNLPILVYYSTNRLTSDQSKNNKFREKSFEYSQFNAYVNAFSKNFPGFDTFIDWFTREEDLENQNISRGDPNYVNPNLYVIRESIEKFFSNLTSSTFSRLRVNRSHKYNGFSYSDTIYVTLEIDKNLNPLKFTQLSDGEKKLLITVCDIAKRLTIANPSLPNPREGKGIVLIDEIDAHLHPQWQREVVPALQKTFPNCQFITTTHSPQVLSNLPRGSIFILENWHLAKNNPYSYGRDTNSILYEFMEVTKRPHWMQERIANCFHLIDKLIEQENPEASQIELGKAKVAIQELQQYLGQNDPDIVQAKTMIHFFELDEVDDEVY